MSELQEVWDYLGDNKTSGDIASVERGVISEETAQEMIAKGECVVCKKFANHALIHESPGTARCCIGCPAENKGKGEK